MKLSMFIDVKNIIDVNEIYPEYESSRSGMSEYISDKLFNELKNLTDTHTMKVDNIGSVVYKIEWHDVFDSNFNSCIFIIFYIDVEDCSESVKKTITDTMYHSLTTNELLYNSLKNNINEYINKSNELIKDIIMPNGNDFVFHNGMFYVPFDTLNNYTIDTSKIAFHYFNIDDIHDYIESIECDRLYNQEY